MNICSAAAELAAKYDNFYLYDEKMIDRQINDLLTSFAPVEFLYSLKTNPARAVVRSVFSHGLGADAASLGEVKLARSFGLPPDKIQYSAPGKRADDLAEAIRLSTVIADSIGEIQQIQSLAHALHTTAEIGVRLNPDFSFSADTGVSSKFGIDADKALRFLAQANLPNVSITGVHVHIQSQTLDAAGLARYYENVLGLALRFQTVLGRKLRFVNMGSGIGIPGAADAPVDMTYLGGHTSARIRALGEKLGGARIIIETGRFVVGPSGYYAAKVMDRKESMGKTYIILSGTLNGFIRPCLARLVAHYAPNGPLGGREPLFTGRDFYQFIALTEETEMETVTLAGNLCTAADAFAEDVLLPKLKPGDVVLATNAGSYGAVLTPMQFSLHAPPAQMFLRRDGSLCAAD